MAPGDLPTRSLSCGELLGLLDEACDALIERDIAAADAPGPAPLARALQLDRDRALRTFEERLRSIEAHARASCCVADVPHLVAVLRVDGEGVSVARFPEAALRELAAIHDHLTEELGRPAAPPAQAERTGSREADDDSARFLLSL